MEVIQAVVAKTSNCPQLTHRIRNFQRRQNIPTTSVEGTIESAAQPCTSQEDVIATPARKRKRKESIRDIVEKLKSITEVINAPVEEDEFEAFGRNVGLQLKNMPIKQALKAQQQIQSYLTQTRLENIASQRQTNQVQAISNDILSTALLRTFYNYEK
uniref:uncharacterized protein LOC117611108 n=1 Tax=Osmia lignaria TaxID=473952 RepID=UPI0014782D11|nr:uncharacterized protein LOC117611108 [Osmia lignaria]